MQQNLIDCGNLNISYVLGGYTDLQNVVKAAVFEPFNDDVTDFLNTVSKLLLVSPKAKKYPDVIAFAFWIRKASIEQLKIKYYKKQTEYTMLGKGLLFHIAPSNVPVNYAYSLVTGLICGNANIVRIPSKDFPQVEIINSAFLNALEDYPKMKSYMVLVRYGHDKYINDVFSDIADVRIIWGGDNTINEIRASKMKPDAVEVVFSDRYSIAVIDAEYYLKIKDKKRTASDFYNDTFLTDQNACTSPRIVIWIGSNIKEAQNRFWSELYNFARDKYVLKDIQAVNKLTYICKAAVSTNASLKKMEDNLIVRLTVDKVDCALMELKSDSGYFYEYECSNIMELWDLCNSSKCQTLSYIGDKEIFKALLKKGIRGIDRIVPIGKTMDFDLIWDGYNLIEELTRKISLM